MTHFEEAFFLFSHLSIFPNTGLEPTLEPKTVKQKAEEELVSTFFPLPFSHYTLQKILPTFPPCPSLGPYTSGLGGGKYSRTRKEEDFFGETICLALHTPVSRLFSFLSFFFFSSSRCGISGKSEVVQKSLCVSAEKGKFRYI